MKKLILILLALLTVAACRSRKKHLEIKEYRTAEIVKIDTVKIDSTRKQETKKVSDKIKVDKKEKQIQGEIQIKGKTDSAKAFDFHNVIDGDTLQVIHIAGNADFIIKTKHSQKSVKSETKKEEHYDNIIQEVARKAVAQTTIKETAGKIKQLEKDVKEKGFTFGAWLTGLAVFVVIVCAVWLFYYLGGKFNVKK